METSGETKVEGQAIAEPETKAPAQSPTAEELRSELDKSKQEIEKWQKEAKSHQSNFSKADAELRKSKAEQAKIDAMDSKIDVVATALAELLDRDSDTDNPKERKSAPYREKLEKTNQEKANLAIKAQTDERNTYAKQIADLTKSVGLDPDSDILTKAQNLWLRGNMQESLEEVRRIVETKKTEVVKEPVKEDKDKIIAELQEEIKKYKGGGLKTELPVPAGVSKTDEAIRQNFRSNPYNPNARKEYLEYLQRKK